jgi:hypothetical protein
VKVTVLSPLALELVHELPTAPHRDLARVSRPVCW